MYISLSTKKFFVGLPFWVSVSREARLFQNGDYSPLFLMLLCKKFLSFPIRINPTSQQGLQSSYTSASAKRAGTQPRNFITDQQTEDHTERRHRILFPHLCMTPGGRNVRLSFQSETV